MQIDNGPPSLIGIRSLRIGGIAPPCHRWLGSISQHSLNGVVGELATKTHKANSRDFMETKARIFALQIDNQLTHLRRETASWFRGGRTRLVKKAHHAVALKLVGLIVQGAFASAGFFRPLRCGLPKEYNGAQQLVGRLLRPERILLYLLPIMGPFSALALALRHDNRLFAVFSLP